MTPAEQISIIATLLFDAADIVEIRTLPGGKQKWMQASELHEYSPPTGMNVYFGANPRSRHGGTAADVALARCLFVDFDGPDHAEAHEKIKAAGMPAPTLTIHSGHGTHCYWRLAEPIEDLTEWTGYQRQLIAALSSDKAIRDPPRIMRLPGTLNVKHEPHVACEIVNATGEIHELKSIFKRLPAEIRQEAQPKLPVVYSPKKLNVDAWLARHGVVPIEKTQNKKGTTQWLIVCPGEAAHTNANGKKDCAIFQDHDGKLGGKCFHSSCGMGSWESLRDAIGPVTFQDYPQPIGPRVDLTGLLPAAVYEHTASSNGTHKTPREPHQFPEELFKIPGIICDMVSHHVAHAPRPRPELSLAATIALIGTVTGRKIRMKSGMRTNIYCIGLAASGSGKERPRHNNLMAITEAGLPQYLGSENPASDAALIGEIDANPAMLIQIDEVSNYFSTIKNAGNNSAHLRNIFTRFLELTSQSENPCWRPKGYADSKKTKQIAFPHLCMFGTGTPDGFWAGVASNDATNGFLARMMVVEAPAQHPRLRQTETAPTPENVVACLRAWHEYMPGAGNLRSIAPQAAICPLDSAAEDRLRSHAEGIEDRLGDETGEQRAIWSRTAAMAAKLALIFAASRGPEGLIITLGDAVAAVKLANWCTRLLVRRVFTQVAENEYERSKKRIMEVIRQTGGITRTELTIRTQWLRGRREREEVLAELVDMGMIEFVELPQKDSKKGPVPIKIFPRKDQ